MFYLDGNQLQLAADVNRLENETYSIQAMFWDASGSEACPQLTQTFTIKVMEPEEIYLPIAVK